MDSGLACRGRRVRGIIAILLSILGIDMALADAPESDSTPEVIAVATEGRDVLVAVLEEQAVYRVSGSRSSRVPIDADERTSSVLEACSRSATPDRRAQCENAARLSLPGAVAASGNPVPQMAFAFDRQSDTSGIATVLAGGKPLRLRISTPDEVLTRVRYLGSTRTGTPVLLAESLRQVQGALRWRALVASYSPAGERIGVLELDGREKNLPSGDYVVVNEQGDVGVLKYVDKKVRVEWRRLQPSAASGGERSDDDEAVPQDNAETSLFDYEGFARASELLDGDGVRAANGPITRADVLTNAEAYLAATWKMETDNYSHEGVPNLCSPPKARTWLRPARLNDSIGQTHAAVPYKWGGFLSVDGFNERLKSKRLAGSVCTCDDKKLNYCIVADAAGVDCSGFVSRAWDVDRHTTKNFNDISTPVKWKELKAADIVNLKGSHVRMVLEIVRGTDIGLRIIESSVSCGGVCKKVMGARELEGYEPRRYQHIRD
jgi:hypothetical protein